MSVVIKGMEMPENCKECMFGDMDYVDYDYVLYCKATKKYASLDMDDHPMEWNCPLISIPTPHGRLIDADKLKAQYVHGKGNDEIESAWISNIRRAITKAPTVIEAEE